MSVYLPWLTNPGPNAMLHMHGFCAMAKYEASGVLLAQARPMMIKHLPSHERFGVNFDTWISR